MYFVSKNGKGFWKYALTNWWCRYFTIYDWRKYLIENCKVSSWDPCLHNETYVNIKKLFSMWSDYKLCDIDKKENMFTFNLYLQKSAATSTDETALKIISVNSPRETLAAPNQSEIAVLKLY